MSSTTIGTISLAAEIRESIRQSLQARLKETNEKLSQIRDEQSDIDRQLRELSEGRAHIQLKREEKEKIDNDIVEMEYWKIQSERITALMLAKQMISFAYESIEKLPQNSATRKKLTRETLRLNDMLDHTASIHDTVGEIKQFVQTEIPNTIAKEKRQEEAEKEEKRLFTIPEKKNRCEPNSARFVSLKMPKTPVQTELDRHDSLFIKRLKDLAQRQQRYGQNEAQKLLDSIGEDRTTEERVANLYEAEISRWEHEAAQFERTEAEAARQSEKLVLTYLSLCQLLHVKPDPHCYEHTVDPVFLQMNCQRMLHEKEEIYARKYIRDTFKEVFEAHGFEFRSMDVSDNSRMHLSFDYDHNIGLDIVRGCDGSFEMKFHGKSQSDRVSQDQRRMVAEKTSYFCSLMPKISNELQNKGIIFNRQQVILPEEQKEIEFMITDDSFVQFESNQIKMQME